MIYNNFPCIGADDPRCPLAGLDVPIARSREAYEAANCPEKFEVWAPSESRKGEIHGEASFHLWKNSKEK